MSDFQPSSPALPQRERLLLLGALTGAAALGLAACGSTKTESSAAPTPAKPASHAQPRRARSGQVQPMPLNGS